MSGGFREIEINGGRGPGGFSAGRNNNNNSNFFLLQQQMRQQQQQQQQQAVAAVAGSPAALSSSSSATTSPANQAASAAAAASGFRYYQQPQQQHNLLQEHRQQLHQQEQQYAQQRMLQQQQQQQNNNFSNQQQQRQQQQRLDLAKNTVKALRDVERKTEESIANRRIAEMGKSSTATTSDGGGGGAVSSEFDNNNNNAASTRGRGRGGRGGGGRGASRGRAGAGGGNLNNNDNNFVNNNQADSDVAAVGGGRGGGGGPVRRTRSPLGLQQEMDATLAREIVVAPLPPPIVAAAPAAPAPAPKRTRFLAQHQQQHQQNQQQNQNQQQTTSPSHYEQLHALIYNDDDDALFDDDNDNGNRNNNSEQSAGGGRKSRSYRGSADGACNTATVSSSPVVQPPNVRQHLRDLLNRVAAQLNLITWRCSRSRNNTNNNNNNQRPQNQQQNQQHAFACDLRDAGVSLPFPVLDENAIQTICSSSISDENDNNNNNAANNLNDGNEGGGALIIDRLVVRIAQQVRSRHAQVGQDYVLLGAVSAGVRFVVEQQPLRRDLVTAIRGAVADAHPQQIQLPPQQIQQQQHQQQIQLPPATKKSTSTSSSSSASSSSAIRAFDELMSTVRQGAPSASSSSSTTPKTTTRTRSNNNKTNQNQQKTSSSSTSSISSAVLNNVNQQQQNLNQQDVKTHNERRDQILEAIRLLQQNQLYTHPLAISDSQSSAEAVDFLASVTRRAEYLQNTEMTKLISLVKSRSASVAGGGASASTSSSSSSPSTAAVMMLDEQQQQREVRKQLEKNVEMEPGSMVFVSVAVFMDKLNDPEGFLPTSNNSNSPTSSAAATAGGGASAGGGANNNNNDDQNEQAEFTPTPLNADVYVDEGEKNYNHEFLTQPQPRTSVGFSSSHDVLYMPGVSASKQGSGNVIFDNHPPATSMERVLCMCFSYSTEFHQSSNSDEDFDDDDDDDDDDEENAGSNSRSDCYFVFNENHPNSSVTTNQNQQQNRNQQQQSTASRGRLAQLKQTAGRKRQQQQQQQGLRPNLAAVDKTKRLFISNGVEALKFFYSLVAAHKRIKCVTFNSHALWTPLISLHCRSSQYILQNQQHRQDNNNHVLQNENQNQTALDWTRPPGAEWCANRGFPSLRHGRCVFDLRYMASLFYSSFHPSDFSELFERCLAEEDAWLRQRRERQAKVEMQARQQQQQQNSNQQQEFLDEHSDPVLRDATQFAENFPILSCVTAPTVEELRRRLSESRAASTTFHNTLRRNQKKNSAVVFSNQTVVLHLVHSWLLQLDATEAVFRSLLQTLRVRNANQWQRYCLLELQLPLMTAKMKYAGFALDFTALAEFEPQLVAQMNAIAVSCRNEVIRATREKEQQQQQQQRQNQQQQQHQQQTTLTSFSAFRSSACGDASAANFVMPDGQSFNLASPVHVRTWLYELKHLHRHFESATAEQLRASIVDNEDVVSINSDHEARNFAMRFFKTNKGGVWTTDKKAMDFLRQFYAPAAQVAEWRALAKLHNDVVGQMFASASPADGHLQRQLIVLQNSNNQNSNQTDQNLHHFAPKRGNIRAVHANFDHVGTDTGRFSCCFPNIQNIDKRDDVRRLFVPLRADHVIVAFDYEQVELRILAYFCKDPNLVSSLAVGDDVHRRIAMQLAGKARPDEVTDDERQRAKAAVYGTIYGMSHKTLAARFQKTEAEALQLQASFRRAFPRVDVFKRQLLATAKQQVDAATMRPLPYVTTLYFWRRVLPELASTYVRGPAYAAAERAAFNTVLQGTAADIIKDAMKAINRHVIDDNTLRSAQQQMRQFQQQNQQQQNSTSNFFVADAGDECILLSMIHDELVFSIRRDKVNELARQIKHYMEETTPLRVGDVQQNQQHQHDRVRLPVKVKVGPSYGALELIDL